MKTTFSLNKAATLCLGLAAAVISLFGSQSAYATNVTWSLSDTDNNWATGANWGGTAPVNNDTIEFQSGAPTFTFLNNNISSLTLNGITFDSGAAAYTIYGNSFTLNGGITNNSTSTERIINAIALTGTQTINTNTGTVNLNGVLSGASTGLTKTGSGLLNLTAANTFTLGAVTVSGGTLGVFQDTNLGTASSSTLVLDGGTLKVAGGGFTNTHATTITANGGTINNVGFSFIPAATLSGGNTLNLTGPAVGSVGYGGPVVNGLGNYGNFQFNGTSTFSGTINVGSGANIEYGSTTALSSATINVNSGGRVEASNLTVSNNITVADGGSLGFQNGNAGVFSGTTTLSGGTANVHMFDWYNYGTARNGAISGKITGAGGLNVVAVGATLTVSGANDYTGATTLSNVGLTVNGAAGTIAGSSSTTMRNSTLTLDYSTANVDKLKDTGSVTETQNAFLIVTPNTTTNTTETIGTLGFAGGNNTVTISSAASRVTTLAASALSRTNNSTALIRGTSLDQSAGTNVSRLILSDSGASLTMVGTNTLNNGATTETTQALKIVPYLVGDTAVGNNGRQFVTYDTTLGLRALQAGEYATLTGTYTTAANPDNALVSGNTTLTTGSDVTINSLKFGTATNTLNGSAGNLIINSGAVLVSDGLAAEVIGSGFSGLTLGNGEGVMLVQGAGALTINTPIGVTGSGGLTKGGGGTLTLGATNSYTGQTTINQGTLAVTAGINNVFNGTTGTPVVLGNNATLNINSTTQAVSSLGFYGSGETVSGASGTLNLGGDITYDATVSQNATSTISVSTLNLNATRNVTVGNSPTIFSASTTNLSQPDLIISSVIADGSGTSGLTKAGAGALALTASNSYTGTTTISGGTLLIGNNGTTGALAAAGTIADNGTLGFSRTNTMTQGTDFSSSAISGTGGLTNFASGTVVLNAANSFSGPVNILNGTLSVNTVGNSGSNSALGTNGTINLGSVGVNQTAVTATLAYTGAGETTDKVINLAGLSGNSTSVLDASGSGLLKFTSAVTGNDGSKTLTLTGSGSGELAAGLNDFGTGQLGITKTGTGTWTLSGANNYTGATTISGGALRLVANTGNTSSAVSSASSPGSALTMNNTATLQLRADADTTFNTNGININSSTSNGVETFAFTFDVGAATSASNKTLTLNGPISLTQGGSIGFDQTTINVTGASGFTLALGNLTSEGSGSGSNLNLNPSSGLTLTLAALTQPGGSNPGVVTFTGAGNTSVIGAVQKGTNRSLTLNFSQTGTVTLNSAAGLGGSGNFNAANLNAGTTIFNNAAAVNNQQINLGNQTAASTDAATFLLGGSTGFNGGLTYTGAVRAYDTTSGLLTLGGQNTSGTNTFSNTVTLGNTADTGKSINLVAAPGGTVSFTGVIAKNGADTTAAATVNGSYSVNGVTVNPSGTVVMANNNTFGGGTTINAGTLQLGTGGATGSSGTGAIINNGILVFNRSSAFSQGTDFSTISGTGSLIQAGAGLTTLTGTNTYSGTTTVNAGTLEATGTAALPGYAAGKVTVNNGGTLAVGVGGAGQWTSGDIDTLRTNVPFNATSALGIDTTGGNFTYGSNIGNATAVSGTIGLTKLGSNTLALTGSNSYSGATTVSAGTLEFDGTSAMSSSSAITVANGAGLSLLSNASATFTPGGNTVLSGGATFNVGNISSGTNQTITLAGTTQFNGSSTLNVTGSNGYSLTLNAVTTNGVSPTFSPATGTTLNIGSITNNAGTYSVFVFAGAGNTNVTGAMTNAIANRSIALAFVQAGTVTISGNNNLRNNNNASDDANTYVNVNSGTTNFNSANAIFNSGFNTGTNFGLAFNLNGGTIDNTSGGAITLNGNHVAIRIAADFTYGGTNDLNLGNQGTTLNGAAGSRTITTSGTATLTLSGAIGNGTATGLTKSGSGTLTLSGNNTYTGATNVNNGTLNVNNALASTTISVASPATLNVGSTAATGTATTITDDGQVNFTGANGSIFAVGSLTVNTSGTTTLTAHTGGAANVKVLDITGLTIDGTTAFAGDGGKDLGGLASPAPVPEPGTIGLLAVGMIGGLLLRRCRKS